MKLGSTSGLKFKHKNLDETLSAVGGGGMSSIMGSTDINPTGRN